jgi:hypothetical protein
MRRIGDVRDHTTCYTVVGILHGSDVTIMRESDLPLPKPVLMALAAFAAIVLLGALVYTVAQVHGGGSVDASLKAGAKRALPALVLSGKGYGSEPTFYRLYQRFVYDERRALVQRAAKTERGGQWMQLLLVDLRSSPPQSVLLNLPGRSPIPLATAPVSAALQKHASTFVTAQFKGMTVRAYLTPIAVPAIFSGQDVSGILEVFQKT